MNKIALCAVGLGAVLASCSSSNTSESQEMKSADFSYMDTTVNPAQDFFQYANGQWLKDNPVPQSESRYGSFNEVKDRNDIVVKDLLEESASATTLEKGSARQLVGDYYSAILNEEKRSELGLSPVQTYLDLAANVNQDNFSASLAKLHKNGFGGFLDIDIYQDLKNPDMNTVYTGQSGLGLPDKEYYFKNDEKSIETREKYAELITSMYQLAGKSASEAKAIAQNIMETEMMLAKVSKNRTELRNIQANYNPMPKGEVAKMSSAFDWTSYASGIGSDWADFPENIVVSQPEYLTAVQKMLSDDKNYARIGQLLHWNVLRRAAGMLTPEMEKTSFEFYGQYLRGAKEMKEDWKRAVDHMNRAMGDVLGKAFVEKAFSEDAKKQVYSMVGDLQEALRARIKGLEWMGDSTKDMAFQKMESFTKKLGYPDEWKDLSSLNISADNYVDNYIQVSRFYFNESVEKIGNPVDKTEWGMPAHIVNAYYNPTWNEIVFPAGIMQPPFFNPDAEKAVNYARMGAVIGHEMIHGFDDQGSQFNFKGEFKNWWTDNDREKFDAATKQLVDQYNEFTVLPEVHVNGQLTLGENIADFGGLTVAFEAYKMTDEFKANEIINGFNPTQRFFIAFAQIWKGNSTEDFLRQQVQTDPHSPVEFRVNGTLANMPEFWAAFDVKEGDPMRNPNAPVIW